MTTDETEKILKVGRAKHAAYLEKWFDWEGQTVPAEERRRQISRVFGPASSLTDPD